MVKFAVAYVVDVVYVCGCVEYYCWRICVCDDVVFCGVVCDGEGVVCVCVECVCGGERVGGRYGGVAKDDDDVAVVLVLDVVVCGVWKICKVFIFWVYECEGVE